MKKQSLLVRFLSWILGIVVAVVVVIGGAYVVIKMKYDVDIFKTFNQVRALSKPVDENAVLTNKFDADSLDSAVVKINASIPTLITKNAEDKYEISSTSVVDPNVQSNIRLTDKEWGALLNSLFIGKSLEDNPITIGNETIPFELVEFDFSDFSVENKSVNLTTVFKLDARLIKGKMTSFVTSLLKNYVPDYFYLFTTTKVTKTETAFEYQLSEQYLKVNNLSKEDSMTLFSTLNKFLGIGEPQEFAGKFVNVIADAILSSEADKGFMYIMKSYNATDFAFVQDAEVTYLEVIA